MQLYRVKLNDGHSAKPEQIAGGFLGHYSTIDPALYTEREAKKKAKMFGGSIEKFGIEYHEFPFDPEKRKELEESTHRPDMSDIDYPENDGGEIPF